MSIVYIPEGGGRFTLSYQNLKEKYNEFINMSDDEFMHNIIDALHFATFICYLKEIPVYICLSDVGIIHELIHLTKDRYTNCNNTTTTTTIAEIRELFKSSLKLS